jgi:hypothetical protein
MVCRELRDGERFPFFRIDRETVSGEELTVARLFWLMMSPERCRIYDLILSKYHQPAWDWFTLSELAGMLNVMIAQSKQADMTDVVGEGAYG